MHPRFTQTTGSYAISQRYYLPASMYGFPKQNIGPNGASVLPNHFAFLTAKNIDWSTLLNGGAPFPEESVGPGTNVYIPMYWYSNVPNKIEELRVYDAATNLLISTANGNDPIVLYESNYLFRDIPEYRIGDWIKILKVSVYPRDPINASSKIRVVPIVSGLPSNRFSITAGPELVPLINNEILELNNANNFEGYFTLQALSVTGNQGTDEGTIIFETAIVSTDPSFPEYDSLRYTVNVELRDGLEVIDRVSGDNLPTDENVAFASNGYYPLYSTSTGAINASRNAGSYPGEAVEITSYSDPTLTYYMPISPFVPTYLGNYSNQSSGTNTFTVTTSGGKYYINNDGPAPTLTLIRGTTYTFDQTDNSNTNHPLLLSTTQNGSHGGGSQYTAGFSTTGNAGSTRISTFTVPQNAPSTLYYYCSLHSNMGGIINIRPILNPDESGGGAPIELIESIQQQ